MQHHSAQMSDGRPSLSHEAPFSFSLGLPRFRALETLFDLIEHTGGAEK